MDIQQAGHEFAFKNIYKKKNNNGYQRQTIGPTPILRLVQTFPKVDTFYLFNVREGLDSDLVSIQSYDIF